LRYWQRFLKYAVALGGWCAGVDGPSEGASMMLSEQVPPQRLEKLVALDDPKPPSRAHSALIPNSLMIGHHLSISAFW
jgi:hypothetical protein